MKKLFLALFVTLVLLTIVTVSAQSACADTTDIGGAGSLAHQTGYVTQYPNDGADEPITDPAPIPTPDPDVENENQFTWRWDCENDDVPSPGGKDK